MSWVIGYEVGQRVSGVYPIIVVHGDGSKLPAHKWRLTKRGADRVARRLAAQRGVRVVR